MPQIDDVYQKPDAVADADMDKLYACQKSMIGTKSQMMLKSGLERGQAKFQKNYC